MHLGMIMECDYRQGGTQEEAFQEAFSLAQLAEETGLDGVWLAERHFAAPRGPNEAFTGTPSIVSVPLVLASAIAARTERLRIGMAVAVLPLCHPIRMAEEAATVDQISLGRLDFGVGRSAFARAYDGYDIPYAESRERFQECLEVIMKAWTQERFSHKGKYFTFNDLCVVPKPYQKPHPPIRMAATTSETFPQVAKGASPSSLVYEDLTCPKWPTTWKSTGRRGVRQGTRTRATRCCGSRSTSPKRLIKPYRSLRPAL